MNLFESLRHTANRFGIDVCRVGRSRLGRILALDLAELTPSNGPIFDVGANTGRAARGFIEVFPGREIWSFEPGQVAFDQLSKAPDLMLVKKFRLALSDTDGSATLNLFQGSELNSLLRRTANADRHIDPGSITSAGTQEVTTMRLDRFCEEQGVTKIALLKLDTQGFEMPILRGAERLLRSGAIHLIQCEITFAPLYENQSSFFEINDCLSASSFGLVGIYEMSRDANGCIKWCDALFRLKAKT